MAGHAILPGCQREWRHDCPGRDTSVPLQSVDTPPEQVRAGGVVCSCPCHGLGRAVAKLSAEVTRLVAEQRDWINKAARLAQELDEARDQLRAAWLGNDD